MPCNLAVIYGTCSSEPAIRLLDSGTRLATLQLTIRAEGEPTVSVPVTAWDPPGFVDELEAGDAIVVVGRVHRRFYRAAGATMSQVEVVADTVAPADRRRLGAARRRAERTLEQLEMAGR